MDISQDDLQQVIDTYSCETTLDHSEMADVLSVEMRRRHLQRPTTIEEALELFGILVSNIHG